MLEPRLRVTARIAEAALWTVDGDGSSRAGRAAGRQHDHADAEQRPASAYAAARETAGAIERGRGVATRRPEAKMREMCER